jgi:exodeoxyribonuclease VII small subunit
MNQIRALMARMQREEGSLDDSLGLYKEATSLIAECQKMLDTAGNNLENSDYSSD